MLNQVLHAQDLATQIRYSEQYQNALTCAGARAGRYVTPETGEWFQGKGSAQFMMMISAIVMEEHLTIFCEACQDFPNFGPRQKQTRLTAQPSQPCFQRL